jgi:hypothetical protein
MAKTRELTIICEEARTTSTGYRLKVVVDDPNMAELLAVISEDDIIEHVRSEGFKPDEVFDDKDLDKWATDHGYTKE